MDKTIVLNNTEILAFTMKLSEKSVETLLSIKFWIAPVYDNIIDYCFIYFHQIKWFKKTFHSEKKGWHLY